MKRVEIRQAVAVSKSFAKYVQEHGKADLRLVAITPDKVQVLIFDGTPESSGVATDFPTEK
jgi:hypothetical protein